jgi:hypothetical protein
MGSDDVTYIYISVFIKIASGVQKLTRGESQTAWRSHKPILIFSKSGKWAKIKIFKYPSHKTLIKDEN